MSFLETDVILADSSMSGADVKNYESHIGNSGPTGSLVKSIALSNGASNASHESNSATGEEKRSKLFRVDCTCQAFLLLNFLKIFLRRQRA